MGFLTFLSTKYDLVFLNLQYRGLPSRPHWPFYIMFSIIWFKFFEVPCKFQVSNLHPSGRAAASKGQDSVNVRRSWLLPHFRNLCLLYILSCISDSNFDIYVVMGHKYLNWFLTKIKHIHTMCWLSLIISRHKSYKLSE